MRRSLDQLADTLGMRSVAAQSRDRIVGILTGDARWTTDPAELAFRDRCRTDDRNLMQLLSFGLRRNSNCLDVGANEGLFLGDFRRVAPDGHHIAYEPLPSLFESLVRSFPDMDIRQRALSDHEGESSFVHVMDPHYEGYSGLQERPYPVEVSTETITVTTERLDDHLPDGWLPDFVKIDVEGAEGLVIAGGIDTLRRSRPIMAIEHGGRGSEAFGSSDEEFFTVICKDIGLRLFDMDGHGPFDCPEFLDMLYSGKHWNWIAHD